MAKKKNNKSKGLVDADGKRWYNSIDPGIDTTWGSAIYNGPGILFRLATGVERDTFAPEHEENLWRAYTMGDTDGLPKSNIRFDGEDLGNADVVGLPEEQAFIVQAVADTLYADQMRKKVRSYTDPNLWKQESMRREAMDYQELSRNIINNPGEWVLVGESSSPVRKTSGSGDRQFNYSGLGGLKNFYMRWNPDDSTLDVKDEYDFRDEGVEGNIPRRDRRLFIRDKIKFNPKKGSRFYRNPEMIEELGYKSRFGNGGLIDFEPEDGISLYYIPPMPDGGTVGYPYIAERDNTSIGGPGISERGSAYHPTEEAKSNPIIPLIAGMIPVIGDAIDAHDLVRAAMENNVPEMALAASGFIPIVGDVFQEYNKARRSFSVSRHGNMDVPDFGVKESDEELIEKMPDYANPNSPMEDALIVHKKRLDSGAYEKATGRSRDDFEGTGRGLNLEQEYPGIYKDVFHVNFLDPYDEGISDILSVASEKNRDFFAEMTPEGRWPYIFELTEYMRRRAPAEAIGSKGGMGIFLDDATFPRMFKEENMNPVLSHEYDHAVRGVNGPSIPKEMEEGSKKWFDASFVDDKAERKYISNPLELSARGSQIKDYFGLTDMNQKVTPEMLKYAAKHYIPDVMNNDMVEFFSGIKDWNEAAKWISKYSTSIAAALTIPRILEEDEDSSNRYEKKDREFRESGGMIHSFVHTFEDGSKSSHIGYRPFLFQGSITKRARYIKDMLKDKYGVPQDDAERIVSEAAKETFLSDRHYNRKKKSYGIGNWSGDDLKEFVMTYRNGGLADQVDFIAKKYFRGSPVRENGFSHALREARGRGDTRFSWNGRTFDTEEKRHGGAMFEETGDIWTTGLDVVRTFGDGGLVERQDHVYERLTEDYGMPPLQAVAIIANLTAESGLDPLAEGDSGQSVGIQQWKGERRKRLEAAARKNGDFLPSLDDQIDFLMSEYKGGGFQFRDQGRNLYADGKVNNSIFDYYQYSKGEFDNADNLWDATIAWNQGVGRPNKKFAANEKRFKIAQEIADRHGVKYNEMSRYDVMGPLSVPPESLYKEKDEASAVQTQENAPDIEEREKEFMSHVEELLSLSERKSGNVNIYINDSADVSKSLEADDLETRRRIAESEQREKERRLIEAVLPGIQLNIRTI